MLMGSILSKTNKIIEIGIGKKFHNLLVSYETDGVVMHGDFLKKPNFTAGSTQFQLTFG